MAKGSIKNVSVPDLLLILAQFTKEGEKEIDIIIDESFVFLKPSTPVEKPNDSLGDLTNHV